MDGLDRTMDCWICRRAKAARARGANLHGLPFSRVSWSCHGSADGFFLRNRGNYREQVWSGHEIWPWLQKGGLAQKATLRRWRGDCSKPAGSLIGCSFCILLLFLQLVICSLS